MAVIVGLILTVVSGAYLLTVVSSSAFRILFFDAGIRSLVVNNLLASHVLFLLIAILAVAASMRSLFVIRNTDLMIGNKRVLLTIAVIALLIAVVLGYESAVLSKSVLLDLLLRTKS